MGDYAEMMLDGTCCCSCGEFLGDGDGYAAYCASCQPVETLRSKKIKPAKYKSPKVVGCLHPDCRKKFIDEAAMRNHLRTFHIDKDALRKKQEKDKKLNNIRNSAPALLEALERIVDCASEYLHMNFDDHVLDDAINAIKLARGE